MSDDLVKRLRDWEHVWLEDEDEPEGNLYIAAADRIGELEAENTTLRSMVEGVIADTGDDPEIMAASRAEWAARALVAEAKLAKAEIIIRIIASDKWDERLGEAVDLACEYLAELKDDPTDDDD